MSQHDGKIVDWDIIKHQHKQTNKQKLIDKREPLGMSINIETLKGLTSWLLYVMFNCVFVTFPCGILGQVWYLIVSIPDLCRLSYFETTAYTSMQYLLPNNSVDCCFPFWSSKLATTASLQKPAFIAA